MMLILTVGLSTVLSLVYATASLNASSLFDQFVATFKKEYPTHEKKMERYAIFTANLERIATLNARQSRAKFSALTRWADMSRDEYTQIHGLNAANYGWLPVCRFYHCADIDPDRRA